jgi:hypothetical protein
MAGRYTPINPTLAATTPILNVKGAVMETSHPHVPANGMPREEVAMLGHSLLYDRVRLMVVLVVLLAGIFLLSQQWAGANMPPPPDAAFVVHVQTPEDLACEQSTITTYDQIIQQTDAVGTLQFDLFVYTPDFAGGETTVHYLQSRIMWPEAWTLQGWETCHQGDGSLVAEGDGHILTVTWPQCPTVSGEMFLAARFVFETADGGTFGPAREYTYNMFETGCPPVGTRRSLAHSVPAQSGVECGSCYVERDEWWPCRPDLPDDPVNLELEARQTRHVVLDVHVDHRHSYTPVEFVVTEPWLSVVAEEIEHDAFKLDVTVCSEGLDPGDYTGWIQGGCDCSDCTRVDLIVTGDMPVPATPARWGQIKMLYRSR